MALRPVEDRIAAQQGDLLDGRATAASPLQGGDERDAPGTPTVRISAARFVERRRSSAVARRHPSCRPAVGTIASRPLEQGSPWVARFLRATHEARETLSAAEIRTGGVQGRRRGCSALTRAARDLSRRRERRRPHPRCARPHPQAGEVQRATASSAGRGSRSAARRRRAAPDRQPGAAASSSD